MQREMSVQPLLPGGLSPRRCAFEFVRGGVQHAVELEDGERVRSWKQRARTASHSRTWTRPPLVALARSPSLALSSSFSASAVELAAARRPGFARSSAPWPAPSTR